MTGNRMSFLAALIKRFLEKLPTRLTEKIYAYSIYPTYFSDFSKIQVFESREFLWALASEEIDADHKVLFLEFGVWEGYSIRCFANLFAHPESRFIGFDSFEGLPEEWAAKPKEHFSTGGQIPAVDDDRVSFVKGWFSETVQQHLDEIDFGQFDDVFVHFDADLYGSTLLCLFAVFRKAGRIRCIFDEFVWEEMLALHSFAKAVDLDVEILGYCKNKRYPDQVYCKITKK